MVFTIGDFEYRGNYHSKIVTVNEDEQLYQGQPGDPSQITRSIDQLFEFERDPVNAMLEPGDNK